jgi:hypothetical protein
MKDKLKVYLLYSIDKYDQTKFVGRFGSLHRLQGAIQGLGINKYIIEAEEKQCEYGGYVSLRGVSKSGR